MSVLNIIRPGGFAFMLAGALAVPAVSAPAATPASADQAQAGARLDQAIAGAHRSADARARDKWRNPRETLLFFGFKPTMTVVEIAPGGGWYTDVLAPALKGTGTYIAALPDPAASANAAKARAAFEQRMKDKSDVYGNVRFSTFGKDKTAEVAPAGTADLVLTFRNVHNWTGAGFAEDAFKGFYAALKPGGVLGVVEHRLPEDRPAVNGKSGYMKESEVIALAEKAGFKLAGRSDVNANPRDTADHPKGVWTLPPMMAQGDVDREKYQAIGESDRMTLRFVKPN